MADYSVCAPNPEMTELRNRGSFTFELTTSALCDLDCTYCFEGAKTNPKRLEELDLLIKRIRQVKDSAWFKETYQDGMSISFWGGEPTLNVNYIIKIMNEFQNDDEVWFHMYTNGFNKKNLKKLLEAVPLNKFAIQVSYDGKPINDKFRLTKNRKTTSDMVMENFEWLSTFPLRKLDLKATVPSEAIPKLYDTWLDYEGIYNKFIDAPANVVIRFAPSLDYSMLQKPGEDKGEAARVWREQILKIAKKEIEFYEKNGEHLMSWFGYGDTKVNCSAGLNMVAVDVDGSTYACHGVLYSPNKKDLQHSSIFDDNFVEATANKSDSYHESVHRVSDVCKDCVATMCMICPVASHTISKKESFEDKWTDRWVNGLCEFYQTFGEIDRTVQNYLYSPKEK
jgi:uncharacterized protein